MWGAEQSRTGGPHPRRLWNPGGPAARLLQHKYALERKEGLVPRSRNRALVLLSSFACSLGALAGCSKAQPPASQGRPNGGLALTLTGATFSESDRTVTVSYTLADVVTPPSVPFGWVPHPGSDSPGYELHAESTTGRCRRAAAGASNRFTSGSCRSLAAGSRRSFAASTRRSLAASARRSLAASLRGHCTARRRSLAPRAAR